MKNLIKSKGIKSLFHFTQADNLPSIMQYGLLTRDTLDENWLDYSYNDSYRYDKCTDAICTSIEFPNYKMFYTLRMEAPEKKWVVIELDASILYEYECAFCYTNAGDSKIYTTSLEDRKSTDAFLHLFDELPDGPTRKELDLEPWYPTHPQAEVLVFGNISLNYIKNLYFNDYATMVRYKICIPNEISFSYDDTYFWGRKDWPSWQ